jgi:hypothetical protein
MSSSAAVHVFSESTIRCAERLFKASLTLCESRRPPIPFLSIQEAHTSRFIGTGRGNSRNTRS